MSNSFDSKTALVARGTSGIGKATAIAFAEAGAKVVLTGRREKQGRQVVAEIERGGGTASFFPADFSKEAEVKAAVDFVVATFGRLDVTFNNAAVESLVPLSAITQAKYRACFAITRSP